jgi:diketogulonate reductase-like aldo/keto reductase
MTQTPTFKLNNNMEIPAVGFGIMNREQPELTQGAIEAALEIGYRLIDTAASYGNEAQVGAGIRASGVARTDIFLTTKLWLSHYGYEGALRGFEGSIKRLGVDYLDLYLLHWPNPSDFAATLDAYRAVETLVQDGCVKAVGVSNFTPAHLEQLMKVAKIVPTVNQVESQPRFANEDQLKADRNYGILTEAWSPLGGSVRRFDTNAGDPLKDATIQGIASKYGKQPSQVILRWHYQRGVCTIPKSVRPERMRENLDIFDFQLSADEMSKINELDTGKRSGPNPDNVKVDTFPINVPF